ncbi:MAG: carbohydrate ABC transporter permease, partial [Flavobacteriales bacterium TMED235]
MNKQIFHDTAKDLSFKPNWMFNRLIIYGILIIWAFICLFPIYWTITTT